MGNDISAPLTPEPNIKQPSDDIALKERELILKEKELALKEQEAKAKIEFEKRNLWFSSPLLIGALSAIFGLIGTGIGAGLQGYSNFQLERQKFESSLIQKSLEIKDRNEAAKSLLFLVDSGIIQSLDGARIRKIAENPEQLPMLSQLLASGGAIVPSPDGKTIAVGDKDGNARIWSMDGKLLLTFRGHTDAVTSIAYSPDARVIFTGSLDKTVKIWELSGKLLHSLRLQDGVIGIAVSPDGKTLLVRTIKNEITRWNVANQEQIGSPLALPSPSSNNP